MTAKRFTFKIKTRGNKAYTQWYDDGKPINSAETVVELLNELNDKCEFFEIENESLEDGAIKYEELYHQLLKENEQLKKEIKKLKTLFMR